MTDGRRTFVSAMPLHPLTGPATLPPRGLPGPDSFARRAAEDRRGDLASASAGHDASPE